MRLRSVLFNVLEGVGIAVQSVRANKTRAALTILGVAVGVFVVVVLSAATRGINESVARDLEAAGPTSFYVYRRSISMGGGCDDEDCPAWRNPPLRLAEAEGIGRIASIEAVTAHVPGYVSVKYKDKFLSRAPLDAYTHTWVDVDGGDLIAGRSFTYAEDRAGAPVVVINTQLAEQVFGESDPLGKQLLLAGVPFDVIGLYHSTMSFLGRPNSAAEGDNPRVIVPLEAGRRHLNAWIGRIDIVVKPKRDVSQMVAMDDVTAYLRGLRGLRPSQPNTFALMTSEQLMEIYDGFFGVFFLIMIALSGVGLMVGGVGVVAIMMISVTERTREIGVRKALGATRATILWQFLVEAATLTGIGAATGLILGTAVAWMVKSFTPIPAETPPMAIAAALLASVVTGMVFGMLPAVRAARLDPIVALRYE